MKKSAEQDQQHAVTARLDPSEKANTTRRETTRLTADLPTQDATTLRDLAETMGFNRVTTLVRAIRILNELVRAERDGGELTIKYRDGHRERLLLR